MATNSRTKAGTGSSSPELRTNEKKWGKLLMEAGWTLLPNTVLVRQAALGLTSTDINILPPP
ncbi:AsnC family transcriptional regulator, partial [mine drainage metagenome]